MEYMLSVFCRDKTINMSGLRIRNTGCQLTISWHLLKSFSANYLVFSLSSFTKNVMYWLSPFCWPLKFPSSKMLFTSLVFSCSFCLWVIITVILVQFGESRNTHTYIFKIFHLTDYHFKVKNKTFLFLFFCKSLVIREKSKQMHKEFKRVKETTGYLVYSHVHVCTYDGERKR